jgi:DeoR family transcriptional regulator, fructose operon transcriptional repressor
MMKAADQVIVVADSTKFGHTSLARVCGLGDVDTLVVDDAIREEWRSELIGSGVELVVAKTTED